MSIWVNEGGTHYELNEVWVNEGGAHYELNEVWSNEGGTHYEIYGATTTKKLTWNVDNSADSAAKINSQSADGFTLNYTSTVRSWSNRSIYCNPIKLKAGNTISVVFSNIVGTGSSKVYALHLVSGDTLIGQVYTAPSGTITVPEDGEYFLTLHAHSTTGSSTGVKDYPCSATVAISIS